MAKRQDVLMPNSKMLRERPQKRDIYATYVTWNSLPPLLKSDFHGKEETLKQMGFEGTAEERLFYITNQTEFANAFGVTKVTLSAWNRKMDVDGLVKDQIRKWARRLTPNIVSAFYSKTLKHADAARVKLWLQWAEGFVEQSENKGTLEISVVPTERVRKLADKLNQE